MDGADSTALLLRLLGHEVQVAHSGPKALDAVASFQPEVVLMDIGLPGMDGYEVARRVRARPEWKQPYLIAVTGFGQESDRQRAVASGFDDHWLKPFDPQLLQKTLADPDRLARR
jgi:CheY-like chemotaxis protein